MRVHSASGAATESQPSARRSPGEQRGADVVAEQRTPQWHRPWPGFAATRPDFVCKIIFLLQLYCNNGESESHHMHLQRPYL